MGGTVSVVLRTRNEMQTLPAVIAALRSQTRQDFELVIIDNRSTDGTAELAASAADRVVGLDAFSHARSTNLAFQSASGDYVYLSNGHSWPATPTLLARGSAILDDGPDIGGVYGRALAPPRANLVERLIEARQRVLRRRGFVVHRHFELGMLHTISTMIRREVALALPFREVGGGGEDTLFALELLAKGWRVAHHPELAAYHAHVEGKRETLRRHLAYKAYGRRARQEGARLARAGWVG